MTRGEQIVRVNFNASNDSDVYKFKSDITKLIDDLEKFKELDPQLYEKAESYFELASIFAVKLITTEK